MPDLLHESLSAAIDDEADELELHRVLNAIGADAALRAKWQRLHLVRSTVRLDGLAPSAMTHCPRPWLAPSAQTKTPIPHQDEPAERQPVEPRASKPPTSAPGDAQRTGTAPTYRRRWRPALAGVGAAAAALCIALYVDIDTGSAGAQDAARTAGATDALASAPATAAALQSLAAADDAGVGRMVPLGLVPADGEVGEVAEVWTVPHGSALARVPSEQDLRRADGYLRQHAQRRYLNTVALRASTRQTVDAYGFGSAPHGAR